MAGNSTGSMPFQTDANGPFELENIPVGTYWIGRMGLKSDHFEVRNGQAAILSLELDKPAPPMHHGAKPYGAPPARRRLV